MSNHFPQTEIPQRESGARELYGAEALWDLDFFGAVAPVAAGDGEERKSILMVNP